MLFGERCPRSFLLRSMLRAPGMSSSACTCGSAAASTGVPPAASQAGASEREAERLADAGFEGDVRVVVPRVGGAFGQKNSSYPEESLAGWAARRLGRPVKWVCERTEHFLADAQGRDNRTLAEMALDAEGRFLAMRVTIDADLGAYLSQFAPFIPTGGARMTPGVYDIVCSPHEGYGMAMRVVVGDAYTDIAVPAHLVTREFFALVRSRLTDRGVYLMNVIDHADSLRALASILLTLRDVFPEVEVWTEARLSDQDGPVVARPAAAQRQPSSCWRPTSRRARAPSPPPAPTRSASRGCRRSGRTG